MAATSSAGRSPAGSSSAGPLWSAEPPDGPWRRYLIADVFTASPLQGNQLGVFPDGRGLDGGSAVIVARGEYLLG